MQETKFQYDKDSMEGTGTIAQYFQYEEPFDYPGRAEYRASLPENAREELKKFDNYIIQRDQALARLLVQLFTEYAGLKPDDQIQAYCPDDEETLKQKINQPGLVMILGQPDDPIYALYKDGKPIAAYYASFRGMYQAGGYIHKGKRHFYAHNFREGPKDVWLEEGKDIQGHDFCSEIARGFLLGKQFLF